MAPLFMGALLGLSAAMALFLLYNVAAGGEAPARLRQRACAPARRGPLRCGWHRPVFFP